MAYSYIDTHLKYCFI